MTTEGIFLRLEKWCQALNGDWDLEDEECHSAIRSALIERDELLKERDNLKQVVIDLTGKIVADMAEMVREKARLAEYARRAREIDLDKPGPLKFHLSTELVRDLAGEKP